MMRKKPKRVTLGGFCEDCHGFRFTFGLTRGWFGHCDGCVEEATSCPCGALAKAWFPKLERYACAPCRDRLYEQGHEFCARRILPRAPPMAKEGDRHLDLTEVERAIDRTEDELENFRADTSLCEHARLMVAEIRTLKQRIADLEAV